MAAPGEIGEELNELVSLTKTAEERRQSVYLWTAL